MKMGGLRIWAEVMMLREEMAVSERSSFILYCFQKTRAVACLMVLPELLQDLCSRTLSLLISATQPA